MELHIIIEKTVVALKSINVYEQNLRENSEPSTSTLELFTVTHVSVRYVFPNIDEPEMAKVQIS